MGHYLLSVIEKYSDNNKTVIDLAKIKSVPQLLVVKVEEKEV